MKSKEEFKERFKNGEFEEDLENISSKEELVAFARGLGYDVTLEDILSEELDDDTLSMVAGGKGGTKTINEEKHTTNMESDDSEAYKIKIGTSRQDSNKLL